MVLRESRGPWTTAIALRSLGNVVLEQGDITRAEDLCCECLTLAWEVDDQRLAGETLTSLAVAAERQGQLQRAARLIGAVDAVRSRIFAPLAPMPAWAARYERTIDVVRAQLGDEGFAAARTAGQALSLPEAIRFASTMMAARPDNSCQATDTG